MKHVIARFVLAFVGTFLVGFIIALAIVGKGAL